MLKPRKQARHLTSQLNKHGAKRANTARRILVFGLVLSAPFLLSACPKNDGPINARGTVSSSARPKESLAPIPGAVAFNGERAMDHVKKQVDFGPRPPGSPELAKTRIYMIEQLKSYGLKVTTDEFKAATPQGEKNMVNVTAEIPGESKDVIIISSHYDSKYFKNMRFVGANDPGSSVATLLELGRVLAASNPKPKLTYQLVLFDGEEAFYADWDTWFQKSGNTDNTYGSRHFISQLQASNSLPRVRAMILLDMMGYKNLELGRDTMSTVWLQDIVWETGRGLGYSNIFVNRPEGVGSDDHEPFLKAGIDSLDLIQLSNYRYWHTAEDSLDKISPQSMKIVGDVILASLPKIEDHVSGK